MHLQTDQAFNNSLFTIPSMNKGLPPRWLFAWRKMVTMFREAERILILNMVQAVRIGIRPRKWLSLQDPLDLEVMEEIVMKTREPCQHETMQRYGNAHGRYAKCLMCHKKWKWSPELEKWTDLPAPKQRSLPLPSSSTASSFLDKVRKPAWSLGMPLLSSDPPPPSLPSKSTPKAAPRGAKPKQRTKRHKEEAEETENESSDYDWALIDSQPQG